MRVVLVDDEPLARRRLEILLNRRTGVDVVGQCGDGATALQVIAEEKPDAVFLDIKMPAMDGIETAAALAKAEAPAVVFVTAYDEHGAKAFESAAVDYLLKPVDERRLDEALLRVREKLDSRSAEDRVAQLEAIVSELKGDAGGKADFWIKDRGRVIRVEQDEIEWVEAERDYVRLHVRERSWLVRETMHRMEAKLDDGLFARVHRSAIVNRRRVRMAKTTRSGARILTLTSGAEVRVGRSYETVAQSLIGGEQTA